MMSETFLLIRLSMSYGKEKLKAILLCIFFHIISLLNYKTLKRTLFNVFILFYFFLLIFIKNNKQMPCIKVLRMLDSFPFI